MHKVLHLKYELGHSGHARLRQQPEKIGEFSAHRGGVVALDRSAARFLQHRLLESGSSVEFDLSRGFETDKGDWPDESLADIIRWALLSAAPEASMKEAFHGADFVCTSGTLATIARSLLNKWDNWKLSARFVHGVIFLRKHAEDDKTRLSPESGQIPTYDTCFREPNNNILSFQGYKFEQHVTVDSNGVCDTDGSIFSGSQFRFVNKVQLEHEGGGSLTILTSAEVDALDRGMYKVLDLRNELEHFGYARIGQPEKIGEFSAHKNGVVALDRSAAKFLRHEFLEPGSSVDFDLSRGFDKDKGEWPDESLADLLRWAQQSTAPGTSLKEAFHGADFVCTSGTMVKIAKSLKNDSRKLDSDWKLSARLRNNVIFLRKHDGDILEYEPNDNIYSYQGFKFEQHMTTDANGVCDTEATIFSGSQFRFVNRIELEYHGGEVFKIVASYEVDALDKDDAVVELKTAFGSRMSYQKLLTCATQTDFAGLDSVIVGWKSEDGTVKRITTEYFAKYRRCNIEQQLYSGYRILALILGEIKRSLHEKKLKFGGSPSVYVRYSAKEEMVYFDEQKADDSDDVINNLFSKFKR